jgi:hypothetical protein
MSDPKETLRARIPSTFMNQLDNWVHKAQRPENGFLAAILANDLREVFNRGFTRPQDLGVLPDLMEYLFVYTPDDAWGYPQVFDRWEGLL